MLISPHKVIFSSENTQLQSCSVCISLYNYQDYIEQTLFSILSQDLERIELVVVDDSSSDKSLAVAESWCAKYAKKFSSIKLIQHTENFGLTSSRNTAFSIAQTEYVFVLDADNLLFPRCLSTLYNALSRSSAGFAYSILEVFGQDARLTGYDLWNPSRLRKYNYIDAMAMVKKSAWKAVGGYSRMNITGWEDYDFWCKMHEKGLFGVHVPEILGRYRAHGKSMINCISDVNENPLLLWQEMKTRHPFLDQAQSRPMPL